MRPPLRASSRQLVSSPKESGEIGETTADIIARHPHSAERVKPLVSRIEEHAEVMTPRIATAFEELVSAALSPMPGRLQPADALVCLRATEAALIVRRESAADLEQYDLQALRDQEAAMRMEMEREQERMRCEKGGARAAKRAAMARSRRRRSSGSTAAGAHE